MEEVLVLLLVVGVVWAHIKLREGSRPVSLAGTGGRTEETVETVEKKEEEKPVPEVAETEEDADPAPASVAQVLPPSDWETVARDSGWFVDPLPDWLVPALQEKTTAQVRGTGEPVDKEKKKELGINPNAKLGWDYVNSLTVKGKAEYPLDAPKIIALRASYRQSRQEELERAEQLQSEAANVKVRITAAGDEGDCGAIKGYEGRDYSPATVPILPLADCDAQYCRCAYAVSAE